MGHTPMSGHHIIPTIVDGQSTLACAHCGMLNSQIRFSRDKSCPCAPQAVTKQWYADGSEDHIIEVELTPETAQKMNIIQMQAQWFHGYNMRQLMRAINR